MRIHAQRYLRYRPVLWYYSCLAVYYKSDDSVQCRSVSSVQCLVAGDVAPVAGDWLDIITPRGLVT